MTPIFLPHTTLDAIGILEDSPPTVALGGDRLRALRDRAMAEGAHVLLLAWPSLDWVLLAVEVPPGVVIEDAKQLIPNLLANPAALDHMRSESRKGQHLSWLSLTRSATTQHYRKRLRLQPEALEVDSYAHSIYDALRNRARDACCSSQIETVCSGRRCKFSDRVWRPELLGAQAPHPTAGAFFVPAVSCYGSCAWETFGSAGFQVPGSPTCAQLPP